MEQIERNKKIFEEKEKGATYAELSLKYVLSRERIYSIVRNERIRKSLKELKKLKAQND